MAQYVGQNVKRKEDYRLLTGNGRFVGDIRLDNMAEAAILRSSYGHALIKSIDTSKAKDCEGVIDVITAADLEGKVQPFTEFVEFTLPPNLEKDIKPIIKKNPEPMLAKDRVTFVGQAIAIVIAENRYAAEDAIGLIKIEFEPLPVVTDPYESVKAESTVIHQDLQNNIQSHFEVSVGDVEKAFNQADHVIRARIKTPRVSGNPLETRGVVAEYEERTQQLQVWSSTQVPYMVRSYLSKLVGLVENNIRVVAPDVGGGFGPKCAVYPEEIVIPYLSTKYKRPIKWIEDRLEHMQSTRHSRDQVHDVEVAVKNDGTILGLKDHFLLDNGAHNSFALCCAYNSAAHLRGMYRIPNYDITGQIVLTNKTPNVPYRGAGRPEAVFVMDRLIYMIAEKLNMDPVDVSFKNFITPEEMPYDTDLFYRDGANMVLENGDYPGSLKQAMKIVGYEQFREQQKEAREKGKYLGIGFSSYIEGTGIGPHEGAVVRLDSSGHILAFVGSSPHGQSHETTLAQICADEFGVSPDQVTVKAGDTSLLPYGVGTFASRGAVTAGSAVHVASKKLKEKLLAIAGEMLEVAASDLELQNGKVYPKAMPTRFVTLQEIALAAKPGPRCKVPEGMEPGASATHYFVPPTVTFSSGFHTAVVEVDKDTGFVEILRYIVVHDCGRVLNPMIVDGQIQGGVAQGIGGALYEEIIYDENGQLVTGTYMDYLLPTAMEVPVVEMGHQEFLSPRNPMGIKGVGEGGAIGPPAAIANAVCDALKPMKIEINTLPVSPNKLRSLIEEAELQEMH
ncbi:xanthine dehydrogenase family protein molybdopterin-binding subunit [Peribacillus saganii]|uniref:Xanthine dehydrogenase family protein molybdopterin-binding subunit n=1 Tax=Peribacillus saganii TaxID=2303992 RepID=A0A372LRP1_9BACI|nr:xanthine dehydrogenase family protein molybdopterin-binding subunit [Peribacillus saganii]RFU70490.1 xanthine dehydrogenase family protein molybdopterin-binding subunit [Peribacillus saganii]